MGLTKAQKLDRSLKIQEEENRKTAAALYWTEPVKPDIPVPKHGEHSEGWSYNAYSKRAFLQWSEANFHGDGEYPKNRFSGSASQGGRALYSTKILALRQLRYARELEAARDLRTIDKMIDEEMAK